MFWVERFTRTLETSSFRHATLIAYVFLLMAMGSMLFASHQTQKLLQDHVKDMVVADVQHQSRNGRLSSSSELAQALAQAPTRERDGSLALVLSANMRPLFGDASLLAIMQCQPHCAMQWRNTALTSHDGQRMQILGMQVPLADGGVFLRAYDTLPMLERLRLIPVVAGSGLFAVLISCLLFGLYTSMRSMRRVDRIRSTLRRYVGGEREARIAASAHGDEFDQLGLDINHMLERTNHLMDELKNVSRHIAHELRTPLTRLHTHLLSVVNQPQGEPLRDGVHAAVAEAERVQGIFRAVLRIGEIEAGRCGHVFEWFDARDWLHDLVDYYQPMADDARVELRIEVAKKRRLYGDRALLFQAMANLIENALKYANGADCIRLRISVKEDCVEMGVADNGPGIASADKEEALKCFRRLGVVRTANTGSGLGLALVKAIASLHGGNLVLEDHPPHGLFAVLRLPALRSLGHYTHSP